MKHLWSVHGGGEEEGGRVFDNIHRAIQSILAHSPMATSVLMQLITKGYPFRGKGVQIQVNPLMFPLLLVGGCGLVC